MRALYRPLFLIETQVLFTTLETAELIKYAANCFLATKITFINEIADLCERLGADVQQVAKGMGLDARIGPHYLHPGPGFGGSCLPKGCSGLRPTRRGSRRPQPHRRGGAACQPAFNIDPQSACKVDPPEWHGGGCPGSP